MPGASATSELGDLLYCDRKGVEDQQGAYEDGDTEHEEDGVEGSEAFTDFFRAAVGVFCVKSYCWWDQSFDLACFQPLGEILLGGY